MSHLNCVTLLKSALFFAFIGQTSSLPRIPYNSYQRFFLLQIVGQTKFWVKWGGGRMYLYYNFWMSCSLGVKANTFQSSVIWGCSKKMVTPNPPCAQVEEFLETVKRSGASYVQVESFFEVLLLTFLQKRCLALSLSWKWKGIQLQALQSTRSWNCCLRRVNCVKRWMIVCYWWGATQLISRWMSIGHLKREITLQSTAIQWGMAKGPSSVRYKLQNIYDI